MAGSKIGGIRETQEMLDFCAEHGIGSEIETIGADEVDEAYDRVVEQRRPLPLRHRHGDVRPLLTHPASRGPLTGGRGSVMPCGATGARARRPPATAPRPRPRRVR